MDRVVEQDATAARKGRRPVEADGLPMPRRALAWATIIVGLTLAVLDGTIANVALPTIAQEFNAPASTSIWIVNGYQLAIVMVLLPLSSLGEKFGYRRVYLTGIALFTLSSFFCMEATSLGMLTAARIVQGLGAAGLMAVNAAVLRYTVPQAKFGVAIGINGLVVASAATAGPVIAGVILSVASWRWLFALNIPLGLLTIALGWKNLPESDRTDHPFDWLSAICSAAAIGLLITTIDSLGHEIGLAELLPQALGMVLAGWALVHRSRRSARPMLPLDLISRPIFSLSIFASTAAFTAQMLAFVSLPFAFQTVAGYPPEMVGILMMPWPLVLAVTAPVAGWLADRHSPAILGGIGLVALCIGLTLLAMLPSHPVQWDIAWRMAVCGFGFGMFQAPNNRILIGSAPKARSGAANGMLGTARLTGQSIGAALVALLLGRMGMVGTDLALALGAGFAGVAALLSLTRLAV
ncbi:MFS transporter [Solirhodobacter olei]|uniref:MFS transporter n=1 Tax=Solirhodobacter olei TaxID=2493082 RepID=UPI000FDA639A|nr:MFS transporter [Solirhodobacter olei]